jgi:hypothetical protein
MSIAILHQPPTFQPVLTDGLFYTISADTINNFRFRYTYDLYVNGNNVFQGKATPNPYGLGVIDTSRILKTYCENNPFGLWNTTKIYQHQTFPFAAPYSAETINYEVYFGYEFSSTELGAVTGFTGSGNTQGPPSIPSGLKKVFQSTMGVNGRATQQDFNMGPFVLSGAPTTIDPTTSGLFLTNSPRTRDLEQDEYYTLAFTNYYLDSSTISEPYYAEWTFYDDQGLVITAVTSDNITTNGGGPRTSCNQVYQELPLIIPSGNTNYNTLYVAAGPRNLSGITPSNAVQYTVQLFGKFTGTTSPIQPTPTPTPTPSATPTVCACKEYSVFNASLESQGILYYADCNNIQRTLVVNPNQEFYVCICNLGDFIIEGGLIVTNTGDCEPPTPTPTRTPTPTPTPLFECPCFQMEITNPNGFSILVTGVDCNNNPVSFSINAGQTVFTDCICSDSLSSESPFNAVTSSPCVTSTPTPTQTPTPTSTPAGVPQLVNECFATCVGGECFCDSATPITLYMAPGLSPGDVGENIYTDAGLSVLFFGDYQYGGIIYNASPIIVICTVGGGC